jgi:molecular chaperone DnaK (HSP70)
VENGKDGNFIEIPFRDSLIPVTTASSTMAFPPPSRPPPSLPRSEVVIAIDFGTTFSGVAYYYSDGSITSRDEREARRIAESVNVIRTWPNITSQFMEKTPTVISYHSDPPTWGASVRPHDEPKVSHFKLGLEPRVTQHYQLDLTESFGAGTHPGIPGKGPLDFTTDYLRCIRRFLHERFLPTQYAAAFLRDLRFSYIITVPAIWTDAAKSLTRQAATTAFEIPDEDLAIVTEPEAAALFCATSCQELDLKDGDHFLVCDAGGGTVVCPFYG